MKNFKYIRSIALFFGMFSLSLCAFAADPDPSDPAIEPDGQQQQAQAGDTQPQPGAARISYMNGDVTTQRGDDAGWGATSINAPMAPGDQIATGEKARAEVQLDFANVVRLADNSEIKIADLTPKHIQLQINRGLVDYSTFKRGEADIEINTPNISIRSLHPGNYRIQVNSNGETLVTVRHGEADITTPKGSTHLKQGEMITVRGTDDPEYQTAAASDTDDWDKWNRDRDRQIADADSYHHTNHYYTGAQDLDANGQWSEVPGYGTVWSPNAGPDWVPYHDGSWVWEPYWGWTWVSYEPWGWAPYHYGRWFYYGTRWCWWPGPVYVGYRPLWAPAYVSFYGFGPRVGFGFGFGSVGWLPIGPFDAYRPWWGRGNVRVVGVTSFNGHGRVIAPLGVAGHQPYYSNVQSAMTNEHVRAAVSTVGANEFGHGAVNAHAVDANTWRGGSSVSGAPAISPNSQSMRPVSSVNSAGHVGGNAAGGNTNGNRNGWNNFSGTNQGRPNLSLNKDIVNTRPSGGNNNAYSATSHTAVSAGNTNSSYGHSNTGYANSSASSSTHTYGGSNGGHSSGSHGSSSSSSHGSTSHSSGGSHGGGGGGHSSGGHHGK